MKINPDCIRDVLLYLEEELTINIYDKNFNAITLSQVTENFREQYSEEDIWYTIYNLVQIRFLEGKFQDAGKHKMSICDIENISWNGHQFLNTVRPTSIWNATKQKAKQIGGMSVHGLSLISGAIIQGLAGNQNFIQSIVEKL